MKNENTQPNKKQLLPSIKTDLLDRLSDRAEVIENLKTKQPTEKRPSYLQHLATTLRHHTLWQPLERQSKKARVN